jgi:hypothetical protein
MSSAIKTARAEIDLIGEMYDRLFDGHPRHSRDLTKLDEIIARMRNVLTGFDSIPQAARGFELTQIFLTVRDQIEFFAAERERIVAAKMADPSTCTTLSEASAHAMTLVQC